MIPSASSAVSLDLGARPLTTSGLVRSNNVEAVHHIGDGNHFFLKRPVVCPQGCGHRGWWLITRDAEIPEKLRCPDCDRALFFASLPTELRAAARDAGVLGVPEEKP